MNLYISDVKMIGHTAFEDAGHLAIVSNGPLLEQILLREILALDGYRITAIEDYKWKDEESGASRCDILYKTDLPWGLYYELDIEADSGEAGGNGQD